MNRFDGLSDLLCHLIALVKGTSDSATFGGELRSLAGQLIPCRERHWLPTVSALAVAACSSTPRSLPPLRHQLSGMLELLPKAKAVRPDVPIIMITAYGDPDTKRKAMEGGASGLLTKPIDFTFLREEIDRRLGQG